MLSGQVKTDSVMIRLDRIQYCMGQYHKEKMISHEMMIGGAVIAIVSAVTATYDEMGYMTSGGAGMIIGGLISVAGVVVSIDAEKWMKRGSIKVGLGRVVINF
jgi:hypothetical protein